MVAKPLLSLESEQALTSLGQRLRRLRIERGDTQAQFAKRLGVSTPTVAAMENGEPTTRIGYWVEAITLLGRETDLAVLLEPRSSLFERITNESGTRLRARRRR